MSQGTTVLPTTGTVSGLAMTQNINAALDALLTNNSGASAPASPSAHQLWLDTSTTPKTLKIRNTANDAWITIGYSQDGLLGWTSVSSFGSGWSGIAVGYTKDLFGMVHLKGYITLDASAAAVGFTLPTGFRPTQQLYIGAIIDGDFGTAGVIYTNGEVRISSSPSTNGAVFLDIVAPFAAA